MRSRSGGQGKNKMQQFRFFRGNLSRWNSHEVFGPNNTQRFPAPASVKFETGCSAGVRSLCAHFWGTEKSHQVRNTALGTTLGSCFILTESDPEQKCLEGHAPGLVDPSPAEWLSLASQLHKNPPPLRRSPFLHSTKDLGTALTYPGIPPVSGVPPTTPLIPPPPQSTRYLRLLSSPRLRAAHQVKSCAR